MTTTALNSTQQRILETVAHWRGPDVPSAPNLARHLGFADESAIRWNFKQLKGKGFLELNNLSARLVVPRLTSAAREHLHLPEPESHPAAGLHELPVFPIACGPLMDTCAEGTKLTNPRDFFSHWDNDRDYLLIAEGDSMFNAQDPGASIFEGDYVHLRQNIFPGPGEIVHAEYERPDGGHDCTLKLFEMKAGTVTLRPLNPEYDPIVLPADKVQIKGVALEWVGRRTPRRK